jgi:hypothetical protein
LNNVDANNVLWIAMVVSALTAGITLVLMALIALFRWIFNNERLSYEVFSKKWFPIFAGVIMGDSPALVNQLSRGEKLILLRLWNYWHESISGSANERLKKFVCDMGCNDVALFLVQKGNRAQKLLSSISLGNLNDRSAWAQLKALVNTEDQIISLHAARALLQIDASKAVHELLPMILSRAQWDMSVLTQILRHSRSVFEIELLNQWTTLDQVQQLRALKLSANLNLPLSAPLIHEMLQTTQTAPLLIATLQLLERLQNPAYRGPIMKLFDHTSASVRAQAVKAHASIADASDIEVLLEMLHDNDSDTRRLAALSLSQPTSLGMKRMALLKDALEDARAYEAAAVICSEQGVSA